ncbi:MAG: dihydrodipicolinate synthase family protein [Chloroflexota bacterium]
MMQTINLKGVLPATILPMTADYEPDYDAFARYLEWLISENAVGLAINMDTGEGPQLNAAERQRVAEIAVEVANKRCAVVAGVMGSTTRDAVAMAEMYQRVGVDGLVVFPNAAFRNFPLDPRIPYEYHKAVADATGLPMILFQLAPVFGGVNYTRETLLRLLDIPEVVGIKEASFDAQYFAYTKETLDQSGRQITLLTGNDRFIVESAMMGAEGALLGFCAIGCAMVAELFQKLQQDRYAEAVDLRPRIQEFVEVIYGDPVLDYRARCKVALAHIGVIDQSRTFVRPPMLQISAAEREVIAHALNRAGMLVTAR